MCQTCFGIKIDTIKQMKTKANILSISLLILILFIALPVFSQNDSIKKVSNNKKTAFTDFKKESKTVNLFKKDLFAKKTPINFKPKDKLPEFKPSDKNYFDFFNKKPKKAGVNFMSRSKNIDSDILVIKYFNGKRITNERPTLKSDYSLGVFYTHSKSVRIEVRDFGLEDGDRIKIYLNGRVIQKSITLKNRFHFIIIELENGRNTISIKALNQGYTGPNTAELEIYDSNGLLITKHTWNISTGEIITTSIIKTDAE